MARRACLAIGVATVTPTKNKAATFGYLDGAPIAAKAIGEWALKSGFGEDNVRIVVDEVDDEAPRPVTRERVQQAVDDIFPEGGETVTHLVLAFCGHGLTDGNVGAISWLFSDSLKQKYRIVSDAFYNELLLHGIERITLVSDACREMPRDFDLARLDPVRGIAVDGQRVASPKFDRFSSCQDGQLGYMVADPTSAEPGKCIFSGVIADVLWGAEPSAITDGVITTNSFGVCVRARTAERAKAYRVKLDPQCSVDPEMAVLYDSTQPPAGPPSLQPWPDATRAAIMAASGDVHDAKGADFIKLESIRLATGIGIRPRLNEFLLESLGAGSPARKETARRDFARSVKRKLESEAAAATRSRAASHARRGMVQIKPGDDDPSNLLISGSVDAIWSTGKITRMRRTSARSGFKVASVRYGDAVLVEMDDGWFLPCVPYRGLFSILKRTPAGEVFQAYGSKGAQGLFRTAIQAIDDFGSGKLGSRDVDVLAGNLRHGKHQDPVLGAICAYLYRAVADIDSIRRMAYFYAANGQAVPYDVALLGEMGVRRGDGDILALDVPKVPARRQVSQDEALPQFVTQETPAVEAAIGGRCPWIAMGWDYVTLVKPRSSALVAGIVDFAREVPRRGFTALPRESGGEAALRWGLSRQWSAR